jgi:hypothetical protein
MQVFNRPRNAVKPDIAFADEILTELAAENEIFRVSDKTSREDLFAEVYPEAEYLGDGT